ncbi:hypothetical protein A8F94_18890 [Bacillus sp. FJAT-27225]|uniref:hypothetical protein n=1 Tax=Bacillus sp. FJAT-27225 TaxID=1743144 RepID=UPI00080C2561|nr:hypothetical protein [Bacillus sp. FJAT-27225]OCA83184.1 hypothetical protein A8F94_18890 [Bacillus sp. FJAT-27225]
MPIYSFDAQEIVYRLAGNAPIREGEYLAKIADVSVKQIDDGRRPIKWDLAVMNSNRILEHLHWIDKPGGVDLLISDLDNLGIAYEEATLPSTLNSLIGATISIYVKFMEDDRTTIFFLERV